MTFLIFGGIWFWSLLILVSLLLIWALNKDSGLLATIIFLPAAVATIYWGNTSWLTWIVDNPFWVFGYLLGYVAIGAIWSVVKWWFFVCSVARNQREALLVWLKEQITYHSNEADKIPYKNALELGWLTGDLRKEWTSYMKQHYMRSLRKPEAADNKSTVIGWLAFWPWSAVWTLINDPVRRFFDWLYLKLSKVYQKITDRVFKDLD